MSDQPGEAAPNPPGGRVARQQRSRLAGGALIAVVALVGGLIGGLIVKFTESNGDAHACAATSVAHSTLPSVVTIQTRAVSGGSGNGSGEIIRVGGYILTNEHVIAPAAGGGAISVLYHDGTSSSATVVGEDVLTDLAVVKAEDGAKDRPLIDVGTSSDLQVGQPVLALGAPLGLTSTVTAGIVSALDRYIQVPTGHGKRHHLIDAIQTDASINPGNSGGALVDCAGHLIGVNAAISTVPNANGEAGGGNVGIGFAIPVDLAIPLSDDLISTGHANHPTFGLQAQTIPQTAGAPTGLFVTEVDPGGPADKAGIRTGDVITEVDGKTASSVAVLEVAKLTRQAGDNVSVTYTRSGQSHTVEVTLAAGP